MENDATNHVIELTNAHLTTALDYMRSAAQAIENVDLTKIFCNIFKDENRITLIPTKKNKINI